MTTKINHPVNNFVFFGTGTIAKFVLEELIAAGHRPVLIVTGPDSPQGRGMTLRPSEVGILAENIAIPTLKTSRIDEVAHETLKASGAETFVVADYGALLKREVLDIPKYGVLNMHPSLLPRLRGPSPIRSAILNDEKQTGVSIMVLDELMDHGPIIAQRTIPVPHWPPRASELEERLAREGGKLLAEMLPLWISGAIESREQNHDVATYTKKFEKSDGEISLRDSGYTNLLKIRAYEGWPTAYTFYIRNSKKIRVQILEAHLEHDTLAIDMVKPEGKGAMPYAEFLRSGAL
jgi:methionyl-tRNA formyltransferase